MHAKPVYIFYFVECVGGGVVLNYAVDRRGVLKSVAQLVHVFDCHVM